MGGIAAPKVMPAVRAHGFTLIELLLAISVMALVAMMVVPGGVDQQRLALSSAAIDVAQAVRFARNESIRRNDFFGVDVSDDGKTLALFRLDTTTTPNSFQYTLSNPASREPYEVLLTRRGVSISAQPYFTFRTSSSSEAAVTFNPFGEPGSVGTTGFLRYGGLVLSGDEYSMTVEVNAVGRVEVGELVPVGTADGNPFAP